MELTPGEPHGEKENRAMDYEERKLIRLKEFDNLAHGVTCSSNGSGAVNPGGCVNVGIGALGTVGCNVGNAANKRGSGSAV
jgi:hypothetical protein